MPPRTNAGQALAAILGELGAHRLYSSAPVGWSDHVLVPDRWAPHFADAHGALVGGYGVAFLSEQLLHVSSAVGGTAAVQHCTDARSAIETLAELAAAATPTTVALHLDFDLDAPAEVAIAATRQNTLVLSADMAALDLRAVLGGGAVGAAATDQLAAFIARFPGPVCLDAASWGAVSTGNPACGGVLGLHLSDYQLAGLDRADVVLTVGCEQLSIRAAQQQIHPLQVGDALARFDEVGPTGGNQSELRRLTDEWIGAAGPEMSVVRAAMHLGGARPIGAVLAMDRSEATVALARFLPVDEPRSVMIGTGSAPAIGVIGATVAHLEGRRSLAVVDAEAHPTEELIDLAASLGVDVAVHRVGVGAATTSPSEHRSALVAHFEGIPVTDNGLIIRPDELADIAGTFGAPNIAAIGDPF